MPETLAARIKRLRLARGMTQQQLALAVGVTNVARWESETRNITPQPTQRRLLAQALGITLDELMLGAQGSSPPAAPRPADRRQPVMQPLRDILGRIQATGEDVLADFVSRVVQVAQTEGWLRRGRR